MTKESIIMVVTAFVTYIFGILAKRFDWLEKKYIPIQNMIIGIVAGVLVYLVGLSDNILASILICLASSFGAGGAYDLAKTKGG